MNSISILTNVMRREHVGFVDDWLDFIGCTPETLIVVTGHDPKIEEDLRALSHDRGIRLENTGTADPGHLKNDETAYLRRQFAACETDLAILVRLDSFPFRSGHEDWLEDLTQKMRKAGAFFITGSTLPFRSDTTIARERDVMLTKRISNNFLVINPRKWLSLQVPTGQPSSFGRYESEGRIETFCRDTGEFGLRRVNAQDWRIFHVQVWDARMQDIRDRFRRWVGISRFLKGYQDDIRHPWEEHYMTKAPSRGKLVKIWLGGIRSRPLVEAIRLARRIFPRNWPNSALKK